MENFPLYQPYIGGKHFRLLIAFDLKHGKKHLDFPYKNYMTSWIAS